MSRVLMNDNHKSFLSSEVLGHSTQGLPLLLHQLTRGPVKLLLLGGVHGDEPEGFFLVEKWMASPDCWGQFDGKADLFVLPRVNPDGCHQATRTNSRGVDLNRNMGTKDWTAVAASERYFPGESANSEMESQLLEKLILRLNPALIISAHSWKPMINYNGPCKKVAEHMSSLTSYIVSDDIGYPTPGSLGTWAGWERKIPTITLEIERGTSQEVIWKTHAQALTEAFAFVVSGKSLE
jgi:protein MpaA